MGLPKHLQDASKEEVSEYFRELSTRVKIRGLAGADKKTRKRVSKLGGQKLWENYGKDNQAEKSR
jgi:hypothetical protein